MKHLIIICLLTCTYFSHAQELVSVTKDRFTNQDIKESDFNRLAGNPFTGSLSVKAEAADTLVSLSFKFSSGGPHTNIDVRKGADIYIRLDNDSVIQLSAEPVLAPSRPSPFERPHGGGSVLQTQDINRADRRALRHHGAVALRIRSGKLTKDYNIDKDNIYIIGNCIHVVTSKKVKASAD
ncbi:MAG: hypothetical protein H0X33_11045 [Taibaiella sp.]|nr:hypothetical protein [Taibaiella sp.]